MTQLMIMLKETFLLYQSSFKANKPILFKVADSCFVPKLKLSALNLFLQARLSIYIIHQILFFCSQNKVFIKVPEIIIPAT